MEFAGKAQNKALSGSGANWKKKTGFGADKCGRWKVKSINQPEKISSLCNMFNVLPIVL